MALILDGTNGITYPSWTNSTRPSGPAAGETGYNTSISGLETWNGSIWSSGVLAAGGLIAVNNQVGLSNYTFTANTSGSSTGPISLANGVTVTLPTGSRWVIL
jgi:hypothetical protein